ncbi:MAG: L-lactate permease [uncultured Acetobacteraceae bacterium]|uniref:L-lactate permease n=1 Tax=uncultured Acetobacteraceae bacterium TaxID=169975 RepID=A0A6J4IW88_9PROT|nr:MAG: L-lactate permease [uncultured Acetobacteraceae bacterium]
MVLLLQSLPLLVLLALLGSGRAGPVGACLVALAVAVPAALVSLPAGASLPVFLADEALRGAFLAAQPVGVVAGGLLFHAAVSGNGGAEARPATAARVFAVTLPMGAFLESVTGFAVGAVFALGALRGMGVNGAVAAALSLQALVLVPWGGLGPGTSLGAALVGLPAQEVALVAAWPNAAWLVLLGPVLWSLSARAGVPVPARERLAQLAMLATIAALLVLCNLLLPFEVAGILATGPVVAWALWRADPPREPSTAFRAAAPYLLLTACLLLARLWAGAPAFRPYADLPGFPLTHVAVVLWLVSAALLLRLPDGAARAGAALRRAARPALAMLLYVVFGRVLAGSGAAAALAGAAAAALGPLAPYAVAPMALLSGVVTGSNVGSNAALMPVQAALGRASGLPEALAPGVHNFAGGAGAGMSVGVLAMLCGLLADGTRPGQVWRLLAPSMALVVALGCAAIWLMR